MPKPNDSSDSVSGISVRPLLIRVPEVAAPDPESQFELLTLRIGDGSPKLFCESSGKELEFAPQAASLLLVPPDADTVLLDQVTKWVRDNGLETTVAPASDDVMRVVIPLLMQQSALAEQYTAVARRLASLRDLHEQLHNSYDSLRTFLSVTGMPLPHLGFHNPPDADPVAWSDGWSEVLQPLPLDGKNLCGVSIYLELRSHTLPFDSLIIELMALDDDAIVMKTCFAENTLRPGWITFAFDPLPEASSKRMALRIRTLNQRAEGPRIALGVTQPHSPFRTRVDGRSLDRSLALKCWATVAGSALTAHTGMSPFWRLDGTAMSECEIALAPPLPVEDFLDLCSEVEGFKVVSLLEDQKGILVHPLGSTPTIARLPSQILQGTSIVRAEVITAHPQADAVEYRLACSRPDAFGLDEHGDPVAGVFASPWLSLNPQTTATLDLTLQSPATEQQDLYLMTRIAPGSTSAFAWAHFRRITLRGTF